MEKEKWSGVFPAIQIPLNSDYSVNEKELRNYVDWLLTHKGISGLVVNGHTGEISGWNPAERKMITKIVADQTAGRALVISGVCAEGTFEAIDHAKDAQEAGADGILLMPPHVWLRFGMKPDTPVNFFKAIAEAIKIKIIVHLYPAATKAFFPVETLLKLCEIPNVAAIKMGTREMGIFEKDVRILKEKAPHVSLISCHDEYLLSTLIQGLDGALVGFAGCVPELITALVAAARKDDLKEAKKVNDKVFPMSSAIYGTGQPSGEAHARMKEALYQRKVFSSPLMRLPLLPLSQEEKDIVTWALEHGEVKPVNLV